MEVVDEDLLEDRFSLASSVVRGSVAQNSSILLPMKRSTFTALYKNVLTEQEKEELETLELGNDSVYYAADVMTRKSAAAAVTNSDDEDGYYVLKPKD